MTCSDPQHVLMAEEFHFDWSFETELDNSIELNDETEIREFFNDDINWEGIYMETLDVQSNQIQIRTSKEIYIGRNVQIDIRYKKDDPNTRRLNEFEMNKADISSWLDGALATGSSWTPQRPLIRDQYGQANIAWVEITGVYSF